MRPSPSLARGPCRAYRAANVLVFMWQIKCHVGCAPTSIVWLRSGSLRMHYLFLMLTNLAQQWVGCIGAG